MLKLLDILLRGLIKIILFFLCGNNSYGQIGNGSEGCGFPTLYKDIVTTPYCALSECIYFNSTTNNMVIAKTIEECKFYWGNNKILKPTIVESFE